ncbi:uncharacterized protein F4812DRAFT_362848 [Daldinia caldariorum]|uniref:uncharacterized protein n=1 Tax=Daldinia caldariorum TaxID=326644 RepID=UPI0020084333|nr:uncharacterized protein F4812DRAFT_362848 [Daldinia caldariorum]KAI1468329.1 hypothetical protein F4812DRAFT_362848 [Daldinia caldariorum]
MEDRRSSDTDSGSTLSFYSIPTQSPQPTARPLIWMRRRDTDFGSDCFSKRESVVIRDSIAYPSESSFEDTIIKGTAETVQRNPSKPRLIDLDYIRRKMRSATGRRGSQWSDTTDTSVSSFSGWFSEIRPPEPILLSPITSQRAVTEMYHESQSDIEIHSRARASSLQGPETPLPPQSGEQGEQTGETVRNSSHESELSAYSATQNLRQQKRSCMRSLLCALY